MNEILVFLKVLVSIIVFFAGLLIFIAAFSKPDIDLDEQDKGDT